MALGGGSFLVQNKILPGSYINFISRANASSSLGDRGVAAMPVLLSWGIDDAVFTITADDFQKNSLKLLGFEYSASELAGLRDLFLNVKSVHLYKVNTGGAYAFNSFCTAKYKGICGNKIKTVILANEDSAEENPLFDVLTYYSNMLVDEQKGIANITELNSNDFCIWKENGTLTLTAGENCSGGDDGTVTTASYQAFLSAIESYSFNTIGYPGTDNTIKALFTAWTKRLRDELGIKFQCVLYKYPSADFEGVISVENKLSYETENSESASLVYWVTGAQAGCEVNKSLTNSIYTGEFNIDLNYTQTQLENSINAGKFMFHKVGDHVRVLTDINSLTSISSEKGTDFKKNQVIRLIDQIANDIATIFNTRYLGVVPNDAAGRISLWNDIVKHHKNLQTIRAIEEFNPENIEVRQGESKESVVVTDSITPVSAMEKLYMTIIVN
ncbi:MAG: phage tail sheath family protein [Oscillospiraceae bacterium]|nr:phage tail sheath family protein [Oscillospiraceae bacterium]